MGFRIISEWSLGPWAHVWRAARISISTDGTRGAVGQRGCDPRKDSLAKASGREDAAHAKQIREERSHFAQARSMEGARRKPSIRKSVPGSP